MKDNLPALPDALRKRLIDTYEPFGVTQIDIDVLMGLDTGRDIGYDGEDNINLDETTRQDTDVSAVTYFETVCVDKNRDPKNVINWYVDISFHFTYIHVQLTGYCTPYMASSQHWTKLSPRNT